MQSVLTIRHFCCATQVKEVAAYALSLLSPETDCVVLPLEPSTRDFAEFCKEILSLKDAQVSCTSTAQGYL